MATDGEAAPPPIGRREASQLPPVPRGTSLDCFSTIMLTAPNSGEQTPIVDGVDEARPCRRHLSLRVTASKTTKKGSMSVVCMLAVPVRPFSGRRGAIATQTISEHQ
eukprot:scaffold104600_cov34-Tisochrysis_lutea.AAC.2